jgi:hypothetical protein
MFNLMVLRTFMRQVPLVPAQETSYAHMLGFTFFTQPRMLKASSNDSDALAIGGTQLSSASRGFPNAEGGSVPLRRLGSLVSDICICNEGVTLEVRVSRQVPFRPLVIHVAYKENTTIVDTIA